MARSSKQPDDWEVRSAVDDIQRTHKHLRNKNMMKHVRRHVKKQARDVNALSKALGGGGSAMDAFG